jgi:HNH endonuclease
MKSAARKRNGIRTDASHHRQAIAKKSAERLLKLRGFEIMGSRRVKNRHLIDTRDLAGQVRVLWFKLGWNPGEHDTSAVQIAMLKKGRSGQRPSLLSDAEVLKRVSRKFERARRDGVTDLLLFSLDKANRAAIASLLIPIGNAEAAFRASLQLDRRRARNGASPALWIKGNSAVTERLQQTVERFATENLAHDYVQPDRAFIDDAIDDLTPDRGLLGSTSPERMIERISRFVRNQAVRDQALARAKGRCELCNEEGFLMTNGKRYLETHHIQALGEEGPDTRDNVIALCANDHRAAHFSVDREALAARMTEILAAKLAGSHNSRRGSA